jgi:hypothetical protein
MGRCRIRWNRKLLYGSLICLSSDGFREHFAFASIVDRDKIVSHQMVGLRFDEDALADEAMMGTRVGRHPFVMVESPAFFEAYRHVCTALQVYLRKSERFR